MTTQVNFKLAKSIQDKGFEETTQKWYSTEGNHYYQDEFSNNRGSVPSYCCEAPTIADVVDWFYKKYEIWISVTGNPISGFSWYAANNKGHEYGSPIEAYEAAIKYVLENLI